MNRTVLAALVFGLILASPFAAAHEHGHATPPPASGSPGMGHPPAGMPPDFDTLDANGDGRLEKGELPEGHPMMGHFEMMDTDKDGAISKAEFDAMKTMHAAHHGQHAQH